MPDDEPTPDPPPPTALEIVCAVPVVDGRIDAAAVAELVPAAVIDRGGGGWPVQIDVNRLIPTLWAAVAELAGGEP